MLGVISMYWGLPIPLEYHLVVGVAFILWGILTLIAAMGLYSLKKWAWNYAVIIEVINLALSIVFVNILGIVIAAIIVAYLIYVKDIFR